MSWRAIQWATGSVGRNALRALIGDPDIELVGVFVSDPAKVGVDAAVLAGLSRETGIAATADATALLALEADWVVYTAIGETRVRAAVSELASILRTGKNVVSSSIMGLIHPPSASPRLTAPLAEACERGRSSLFTNGIDPGFTGDAMPLAALQLCERVESVRVQELFDYGTHADPSWALPFGFGKPPDAPAPLLARGVPTLNWGGMVRFLADVLGVELEEIRERTDRWVADEPFECAMLRVERGCVGAVRFAVEGLCGGRTMIAAEHVSRLSPDAAPEWPRPTGGRSCVHRVAVEGVPSLTLDLELHGVDGLHNTGGVTATAMRLVNAIPAVCAAPPGLLTAADLPPGHLRRLLAQDRSG